jgi:hypothetical protein
LLKDCTMDCTASSLRLDATESDLAKTAKILERKREKERKEERERRTEKKKKGKRKGKGE